MVDSVSVVRQSFTNAVGAYRADVSVGLRDFFSGRDGRFTFYKQNSTRLLGARPGDAGDTEQSAVRSSARN
jgi:hypothetical protein